MSKPATPNWKTGEGYPSEGATLDEWESEFLRRGTRGLTGRPHFKLPEGGVEFFAGPAIVQIESDGSAVVGADPKRSSATHMLIEFQLDQDIEPQLDRARVWLSSNQAHRFFLRERRKRVSKYRTYLRVLDGVAGGARQAAVAAVLYPSISRSAATKRVSKDLSTARRMCEIGLRPRLIRK